MLLTTPRLVLSRFDDSFWPFYLRMRLDPAVMRYMGEILNEAGTRQRFETHRETPGVFMIHDHQGTPCGDIGIRISERYPDEADIGYALAPQAQGKGIASEALQALCEYAFRECHLHALNAWVLAENSGSVALLEKHGFRRIQVLEKAFQLNGVLYDDWVYRLEREWR